MDDTISRQAAVDALIAEGRNVDSHYLESERIIVESDAVEALSILPSADRPSGEWVQDTYGWVYCSHCKKYLDDYQVVFFLKPFDYCPNCGADMKGGDNEID